MPNFSALLSFFVPRVGEPHGIVGRLACRWAGHPAGPVYGGPCGELRDLRCRCCGEDVD